MNLKELLLNCGKWLLTRVGWLYLLICLIAPSVIDLKGIHERLKVKRLNDNRPNFEALVLYELGRGSLIPKKWHLFEGYMDLVLSYVADDPVGQSIQGALLCQSGDCKKGVRLLEKSSQKAAVLFWPDYNLGVYYYKQGQYKEAVDHLQRATQIPSAVIAKFMLESIMYRQIFSSRVFDVSLESRIQYAQQGARILLLASLDKMGADAMLWTYATKNIEAHEYPQMAPFYYYAALAAFKTQQLDKAVLLFQKTVELDPKAPWAYFWLSRIFDISHDTPHAQEYFKAFTLLKSVPENSVPYDEQIRFRVF